jgi:hypothetical protein
VAAAAPATALTAVPTVLLCCLRRLADASRAPTPEGSQPGFPRGDVATPIRPVTGRPSPAPSSFTRNPIGRPYELPPPRGGLRAYHVPQTPPRGLGRASGPVARHLRPGTVEPRPLATYLLVQACQQLPGPLPRDRPWLVEHHGPLGTSPGLTVPRLPSSRPRCCSQSRFRLTPPPPAQRLRLPCPAGFAPRRSQRRTLR